MARRYIDDPYVRDVRDRAYRDSQGMQERVSRERKTVQRYVDPKEEQHQAEVHDSDRIKDSSDSRADLRSAPASALFPRETSSTARQYTDPREEKRRTRTQDSDRISYSSDSRIAFRSVPDSALQRERDFDPYEGGDTSSRYMDAPPVGLRERMDLQPVPRTQEPPRPLRDYFLPGEDINREVIQNDICRYLGNDAKVRPYTHSDGRRGYLISSSRSLTTVSNAQMVRE